MTLLHLPQSGLGPIVLCLSFSICIYEMPMCSGDLEEPSANVTFLSLYMVGSTDDTTLLPFKKGDLLILTKKQGPSTSENWIPGQNDRTGKTGLVPMACLYIIPSITKPSAQLMVCHMQSLIRWGTVSKVLGCLAWDLTHHLPLEIQKGHMGFRAALPTPINPRLMVKLTCLCGHLVGVSEGHSLPLTHHGNVLGTNSTFLVPGFHIITRPKSTRVCQPAPRAVLWKVRDRPVTQGCHPQQLLNPGAEMS